MKKLWSVTRISSFMLIALCSSCIMTSQSVYVWKESDAIPAGVTVVFKGRHLIGTGFKKSISIDKKLAYIAKLPKDVTVAQMREWAEKVREQKEPTCNSIILEVNGEDIKEFYYGPFYRPYQSYARSNNF